MISQTAVSLVWALSQTSRAKLENLTQSLCRYWQQWHRYSNTLVCLSSTMSNMVGWLFWVYPGVPLSQYFSLYWAISQEEGEKGEKRQIRVKMSKTTPTYRIFPAIRRGFRPSRMTSNNLISPMKFCYNTNSTLPKQCQSSRSVLQDGSRTFGLFWKEKTPSYNRRNTVHLLQVQ